ncbi:hypothetical protein BGW38_004874 [Lunasporangiospora selenospora]|uniref:THO1-MOS11 C-terminal domain-containing protein n=1 Tax=Lunasporangiospora selenospora TaxID=979761 RepID=A0A9P6G0J8_9FUNG|nr:hypothetical protein BGW38_004874 [Lunasporangiospora selenospora]
MDPRKLKDDLVVRLLEHQKAEEEAVRAAGGPVTGSGDAFDWDESKFDVDALAPPADPTTEIAAVPAASATQASAVVSTNNSATTVPANPTTAAGNASTSTTDAAGKTATSAATASGETASTVSEADRLKEEYEKRKSRAARFGIPLTEDDRALERAVRFGVPLKKAQQPVPAKPAGSVPKTAPPKTLPAKALPVKSNVPTKPGSMAVQIPEDVLKRRQAKFGVMPSATESNKASAPKVNKAPAIALNPEEEEKKRKRAIKFGLVPTADDASKKQKV